MSSACPVCRSASPREFLRRERVPVHQNLLIATRAEARRAPRAALIMYACSDCGFIFNAAFDAARLEYGPQYDNTQDCSPIFSRHMDELARHLVEDRGVRGKRIVEIGCGNGAFLQRLVSYPGAGNLGFGFDPSYAGLDTDFGGRLVFHRRLYGPDSVAVTADVVICRHVIEHVADPVALLRSARAALGASDGAHVFFETPCVSWILRNQVLWDFFYEHCSLFTADSLGTAFEAAGFRVETARCVFGDQYLWLEAVPARRSSQPRSNAGEIPVLAARYAAAERQLIRAWKQKITQLARGGRVALWGAGAKGSTFANLVDPDGVALDCVVDLNPNKQGRFIPGTGHPIVDFHELPRRGVTSAILMNPNYREENLALLRQAQIQANLVEWI